MDAPLALIPPILGALVAGGAIGFEREYRARPAGLRTHMLVALASALLMLGAVHQITWLQDAPPRWCASIRSAWPTAS
jgi:putative Mg2+ transporter-C (MgtC) family protein